METTNFSAAEEEANAKKFLGMAHQLFGNISAKHKNSNLLYVIEDLLDGAQNSLILLSSESSITSGNPLQNEYDFLRARCRSIEDAWNYLEIDKHNVTKVPNDGNCLFSSFVVTKDLEYNPEEVGKIRKETVQWIFKNRTDQNLQQYLLQSLAEHYGRKEDNLKEEQETITAILMDSSQLIDAQIGMYTERQESIKKELEIIDKLLRVSLPQANGDHKESPNFILVEQFISPYLEEMACNGVHGGVAEIYALTRLRGVDASVHEYENDQPSQHKCQIVGSNRSPEKWYVALYHIPGTRSSHYSPFFPTWV